MTHSESLDSSPPLLRRLCVVCLALVLLLPLPGRARADTAPSLSLPLLVPTESTAIELLGCFHVVIFNATEEGTVLRGSQRYTLHNGLNDAVSAQVGLVHWAELPVSFVEVSHGDTAQELDSGRLAEFPLTLAAGQTMEVVVSFETAPMEANLVAWTWSPADLQPWGKVPATRVILRYPERISDEVLLAATPAGYALQGAEAVWDLSGTEPLQVVSLAPATWSQLGRLRAADDPEALGLVYLDLGREAAERGWAGDAFYAAGIGELLTAIQRHPDRAALRASVADLYAARAEAHPDERLPYLALAVEQLEAIAPAHRTPELDQRLGELSLEAALAAEEAGNPAMALAFVRQAEDILGGDLVDQRQEALALRLALSLAESGRLQQALEAIKDEISPQTRDSLLRYAPPFASVVTTITVSSEARVAEQRFRLYAPTAETTCQRLQDLALRLSASELMSTSLACDGETATLRSVVPRAALASSSEDGEWLADVIDANDLLSAVVQSSWGGLAATYLREQNLWRTTIRYEEQVDLGVLGTLWAAEDSLVQWQAIEIEGALAPGNEPTYEQRLAYHALAEQRDIWRDMPQGSYWIYQIALDDDGAGEPFPVGRVSFGERGQPAATFSRYDRGRLIIMAVAGVALLGILLLRLALGGHSRTE